MSDPSSLALCREHLQRLGEWSRSKLYLLPSLGLWADGGITRVCGWSDLYPCSLAVGSALRCFPGGESDC